MIKFLTDICTDKNGKYCSLKIMHLIAFVVVSYGVIMLIQHDQFTYDILLAYIGATGMTAMANKKISTAKLESKI